MSIRKGGSGPPMLQMGQGPRWPSYPALSQTGPASASTSGALGVPAVTEDIETCPRPGSGQLSLRWRS